MAPPKKSRSKPQGQRKPSRNARGSGSVQSMQTYDDTLEQGGADEFHKNRDKILLDDTSNTAKLRSALGEEDGDEFFDEEEVFRPTYDGEGSDAEEEEDHDEGEVAALPKKERKRVLQERAAKGVELPAKGRYAKPDPTSSDEEDDNEDDDEDASAAEGEEEDSEEEETWGANASAYYARPSARRGRDEVDSDSEDEDLAERRMLEEKEVRMQQRKARETMAKGDWGLDDLEAFGVEEAEQPAEEPTAVFVPTPETTDPKALLAHLSRHSPETLALAREWPAVIKRLPNLIEAIKVRAAEDPNHPSLGMMSLHYQTFLTYTTTLAFYLHLASLPLDTRPDLSTHPVLQRLVQLKEAVSQLDNLDFAGDASDEESESDPDEFTGERYGDPSFADEMDSEDLNDEDATEDDDDDEEEDEDELLVLNGPMDGKRDAKAEREWRKQMLEGLEEGELDEIMADMARMKEGGAFDDDMDSQDGGDYLDDDEMDLEEEEEEEEAVKPVKAKRADKKEKTAKVPSFPTIEEPTPSFSSSSKKSKKTSSSKQSNADDALTEDTALSAPDSDAKSAARHSLRFHVSKIESAASRRASARSGRMGGDDDVPYRNKQAGRDAALRKNSAAGAASGDGDDLDGEEWGEADRRAAKEVREMDGMDMGVDDEDDEGGDAGEGDDGYYQLVKKRKRVEKEEKQAAYDEAREEERYVAEDAANGPRSLTRAILKNKGLTPSRSKAVRNPRVKKRMRFDKAKKQVGSMQAVYKGGQSALTGNYGGEQTGISQVVKSRKF